MRYDNSDDKKIILVAEEEDFRLVESKRSIIADRNSDRIQDKKENSIQHALRGLMTERAILYLLLIMELITKKEFDQWNSQQNEKNTGRDIIVSKLNNLSLEIKETEYQDGNIIVRPSIKCSYGTPVVPTRDIHSKSIYIQCFIPKPLNKMSPIIPLGWCTGQWLIENGEPDPISRRKDQHCTWGTLISRLNPIEKKTIRKDFEIMTDKVKFGMA